MAQTMISPRGEQLTEIFSAASKAEVMQQMDVRRAELERLGYQFAKRTSIGRNTQCPCGSGRKFKKCCLLTGASSPPVLAKVA